MKKSVLSLGLSKVVNLVISNKEVFMVLSIISAIVILINIGYRTGVIVEYSWQR